MLNTGPSHPRPRRHRLIDRDPELQRPLDESAIRNLLDKYPRALDRQDPELLASLFHPGAQDGGQEILDFAALTVPREAS